MYRFIVAVVMKALIAGLLLALSHMSIHAQDDESKAATNVAATWVGALTSDVKEIYKNLASPQFRQAASLQQFNTAMSMWKIQVGGEARAIDVVGSTYFHQAPNGAIGDFYYVRLRSEYPNGPLFVDVYLSKIGPIWRVDGFNFSPAPTAP